MCDDQEYDFYSINELSRNINSITKHYFTVDSVYKLNDLLTIGFSNFNSNPNSNYTLSLKGTEVYTPSVTFSYIFNDLNLPNFYCENIPFLKIYADHRDFSYSRKIQCNNLDIVLFNDRPINTYFNKILSNLCTTF